MHCYLKNVFKINEDIFNDLTLEEIIAIPETYFTAFGSIDALNLKKNDSILIRGATSALGITAMQLADAMGANIIATSRSEERFTKLKENGADECIVDDGLLSEKIKCDKVLELIGPKTLDDSMKCLNENGICCVTGILGGVEYMVEFDPIKTIPNRRYLTSFFSNYPSQDIIDELFKFIEDNSIKPSISRVFSDLADIGKAHELMESNNAQGKLIFKLE